MIKMLNFYLNKNIKKPLKIYLIILLNIILLIFSCHTNETQKFKIKKSVRDKKELQKVITHYSQKPSDSLKYKAAVFLIENLAYHRFKKPTKQFDIAFDSIIRHPVTKEFEKRHYIFETFLDSISENSSRAPIEIIYDEDMITAVFLIENIELAFKAWYRIPKDKRAPFADFCNYVLPYRSAKEPLTNNSREYLFNKYKWVYNYMNKGVSLEKIVDSVKSSFSFTTLKTMGKYYKMPLSLKQVEQARIGKCDDGVNYYVNVFRALGIVAARDYVEHWGNNPSSNGHSWIYTKLGNEAYRTDVHRKSNISGIYKNESIPKVFRTSFKKRSDNLDFLDKDVTHEYILTKDIEIENTFNVTTSKPTLHVFDKRYDWFPVDIGSLQNGKFKFKNIGTNVLYLPMDVNYENPLNYPFYIDKSKKTHFFKPNNQLLDSVILTRKIGLSTRRYRRKIQWIENLNGGVFEAANNPKFKDANILHKISNFKSTHLQKIKVEHNNKFKYIRFRSNKPYSFLAKLAFYDSKMKLLKGKVIEENIKKDKENYTFGAYDNNKLTYDGGDYFELGYCFKTPQNIRYIEFQARNDDNHINEGEDYELFYWNKAWKSLGKQKAKDTLLVYKNVPENSILWLKNLTKGKEEHVFIIDENKKQKWLGFENK